jgi:hypothetical protein
MLGAFVVFCTPLGFMVVVKQRQPDPKGYTGKARKAFNVSVCKKQFQEILFSMHLVWHKKSPYGFVTCLYLV